MTAETTRLCSLSNDVHFATFSFSAMAKSSSSNDSPKYACPECGEVFAYRQLLSYHIQSTHVFATPLPCDQCEDKTKLYTRSQMIYHIKKCHSKKPHIKCPDCNMVFLRGARDYAKHKLQPGPCNVLPCYDTSCDRSFRTVAALHKHVNQCHPDWKPNH